MDDQKTQTSNQTALFVDQKGSPSFESDSKLSNASETPKINIKKSGNSKYSFKFWKVFSNTKLKSL